MPLVPPATTATRPERSKSDETMDAAPRSNECGADYLSAEALAKADGPRKPRAII
jgi:hypothetical protein